MSEEEFQYERIISTRKYQVKAYWKQMPLFSLRAYATVIMISFMLSLMGKRSCERARHELVMRALDLA